MTPQGPKQSCDTVGQTGHRKTCENQNLTGKSCKTSSKDVQRNRVKRKMCYAGRRRDPCFWGWRTRTRRTLRKSGVQQGRHSPSVVPVPTDSRDAQRLMRHHLRCDSGSAVRAVQVLPVPVPCQSTPG